MSAGHVYVLAFSNGTVKVGKSQDAARRIGQHKSDARRYDLTVTDEWASPLHVEWGQNEEKLKEIAASLGGVPAKREYFSGVTFAAVVGEARNLPFTAPETARPATGGTPARRHKMPAGSGFWLASPHYLASKEGRGRLRKICELLDLLPAAGDMQGFYLNQYIAEEFGSLVTEIQAKGAVLDQIGQDYLTALMNETAEAA